MLRLNRNTGERIFIGANAETKIKLVDIDKAGVTIEVESAGEKIEVDLLEHESVIVGDAKIVLARLGYSFAGFAVKAPKEIPIHREEIFNKIQQLQQEMAA